MGLMALFEHASGYGLFSVLEMEEISMFQEKVEKSITEFGRFASIVKLEAFSPFKSGAHALENVNCISEGVMHDDLKVFLDTNLPKKKKKITLGVADSKIGAAIQESLGVTCQSTGVIPEVTRGLRCHFHKMVKGLSAQSENKAQLGLGHSYSRAKVKFNVHRVDNMIIQSIALLDQLDKDINTFAMRIREWYSYHFPELIKVVGDNTQFAKLVKLIKNRKELNEDMAEAIEEITMDSAKTQAIFDASRSSMGMDISVIDLINIESFASRVIALADYRKNLMNYLKGRMHSVAPNLSVLIGEQVGARLISHAGSLTNLAKYPASTVQILGAEKALFRALKTRGNTPKYGLLFHSTFIGRAGQKNKGRISRYLANKCSIASRIDCFSETPTTIYGEKLKDQVEERLKFYETGEAPRKNTDVMKEAVAEAGEEAAEAAKKKKKKAKKRKAAELEEKDVGEVEETPKKKKKAKKGQELEENGGDATLDAEEEAVSAKKKKKKAKKSKDEELEEEEEEAAVTPVVAESSAKKKKKAKKSKDQEEEEEEEEATITPEEAESPSKKKKKKSRKSKGEEEVLEEAVPPPEEGSAKKKKKKKQA